MPAPESTQLCTARVQAEQAPQGSVHHMPVVAAKLVSCWVFEKRKDSMLQVTGEEREAYIFTDEAAVVVLSVQREDAIDHARVG